MSAAGSAAFSATAASPSVETGPDPSSTAMEPPSAPMPASGAEYGSSRTSSPSMAEVVWSDALTVTGLRSTAPVS